MPHLHHEALSAADPLTQHKPRPRAADPSTPQAVCPASISTPGQATVGMVSCQGLQGPLTQGPSPEPPTPHPAQKSQPATWRTASVLRPHAACS